MTLQTDGHTYSYCKLVKAARKQVRSMTQLSLTLMRIYRIAPRQLSNGTPPFKTLIRAHEPELVPGACAQRSVKLARRLEDGLSASLN